MGSSTAERVTESAAHPSGDLSLPSTSLIICSRDRPDLLLKAVQSVLQGVDVPTELVVIDQSRAAHPSLSTMTSNRACEIRYIQPGSVGLSRAVNDGVAAARHDLLVLSHDDVSFASDWFGSIVRALVQMGPRSVVTGRVLPGEAETPGGFAPSLKVDRSPAVYEGRITSDVLYPMNMAMYRSAIDDVGRLDERLGPGTPFPAAEDNDFGFRLLEAGYRIVYAPEAVVYHRAWRAAPLRLDWGYGRGQGAYYAKYLSPRDLWMLRRMCRDIAGGIRASARALARGELLQASGQATYVLGMLSGAAHWLLIRRMAR
jgi:GT2 family glycosyltransferase